MNGQKAETGGRRDCLKIAVASLELVDVGLKANKRRQPKLGRAEADSYSMCLCTRIRKVDSYGRQNRP